MTVGQLFTFGVRATNDTGDPLEDGTCCDQIMPDDCISTSGSDVTAYIKKPGQGIPYCFYVESGVAPCTPIWEARFNGQWDATNRWFATTLNGSESEANLYPVGSWHIGFRPSYVRITFTKDDQAASVGAYIMAGDEPIAVDWSYDSGSQISIDFNACGGGDCGDISSLTVRRQAGSGHVYISNIEFLSGVWMSYFCDAMQVTPL